jgi:hypothetical protein
MSLNRDLDGLFKPSIISYRWFGPKLSVIVYGRFEPKLSEICCGRFGPKLSGKFLDK